MGVLGIYTGREPQSVDLNEFLDQLKSDYEVRAEKKEVRLVWDYPADAATINTDRAKLQQILQNLINNALKFTAAGAIAISARRQEGSPHAFVQFKVSDTGIGIAPRMHEQIFKTISPGR
ncbi:MAG: sensor histidine kinase [Candidatus Binatia bacterium]